MAQPVAQQSDPAPGLLKRLSLLLGLLLLAATSIVLAAFLGLRTYGDHWPILVTATGMAVYIAVAVTNPRHALMLWVATAPFTRFVHLDLELGSGIPNLTLSRVMTGLLIVLLMAQLATRRRQMLKLSFLDLFVVGFMAASALSVPNAIIGLKQAAQSFFDLMLVPAAIYFLARHLVTNQKQLRDVMIMLMVVGAYFGVIAIHEQVTGVVWFYPEDRSITYTDSIRRVVGLLGNPAYIAVTIGMAVPWAWYLYLNSKRRRLWLLGVIGIMTVGVFMCMNRSGWVGLALAMLVQAVFMPRFRRIFVLMMIAAAIVAVSYWALIVTSTTVQERLTAQGPIDYRLEAWDVALRMIRDHLMFGVGWENYRLLYPRYGHWDIYLRATPTPHNTYLWVMVMGGMVAFVPFALMLLDLASSSLTLYFKARSKRKEVPYADIMATFMASMACIWAPALVMDIFTGYYNTMIMFMIMGSVFGVVSGEQWSLRLRHGHWGESV